MRPFLVQLSILRPPSIRRLSLCSTPLVLQAPRLLALSWVLREHGVERRGLFDSASPSAIGSDQRERTLAGVRQHRRFLCAGPGWGSSGFQREASQSFGFSILLGGQGLQGKYLQSSAPFPHVRRGRARRESERHPGRLRLLRSPFLVGGSPGGF